MGAKEGEADKSAKDITMTDADAAAKNLKDAPDGGKGKDPKKDPKKKPEDAEDELSEEDRELKEKLHLLATRALDPDVGVQRLALETIRSEIRSATSSMTSVPKPLKFLRDHFLPLKKHYAKMTNAKDVESNKKFLADILSVLSMTMGDEMNCESLRYKLLGTPESPHEWGHEYIRHLAGEISREYNDILMAGDAMVDDTPAAPAAGTVAKDGTIVLPRATEKNIMSLVDDIVPFLISSNAEPEAVDLLIEVDALQKLPALADEHNYSRVCLYLKSCADYAKDSDVLLSVAADIYIKVDKLPDAMQVAIRRGDQAQIVKIYTATAPKSAVRVQLAFDLARANVLLGEDVEPNDELREVMSNRKRTDHFKHLGKDLDVMEPKVPEDIYKTHLIDSRVASAATSGVDSARANLASTFVNAFVNMGFGVDKLMSDTETSWIYRNKEHGMMSAAASLGMIGLWDEDMLGELDKYLYVEQEHVKAGALLGIGMLYAGTRNDVDAAYALLSEHLTSDKASIRNGAISGLAIAYAGTCKEDIKDTLVPILLDHDASADTVALASLCLGLVYIGSGDEELSISMIENLGDRKESSDINANPMLAIMLPLGLGLLFLGKQEAIEAAEQTLPALVGTESLLGRMAMVTLQACAYCGTGDIEQVQKFLTICGEHPAVKESDDSPPAAAPANADAAVDTNGAAGSSGAAAAGTSGATGAADAAPATDAASSDEADEAEKVRIAKAEQSVAVLGLAMVAMGEELGAEMSVRTFGHLLQYGDEQIRQIVPLALGLLSVSNPKLTLVDLLSKFTHDSDMDVAQAAIVGLGMIGTGTNNSRIAGILRQLSVYYSKDPQALFLVRIAQGLLHSGKGLVTMSPHYGDNKFMESKPAMGGIITVLFSCLNMKATIVGKHHYLLYFLSLAARPRMVFTVDEELNFVGTTVRVGNAVDTVGQAGRPKSITGFQTHSTPVLIAGGERAELATDQYLSVAASIEGVVVVTKNPDWEEESGLAEAAAKMEEEKKEEEGDEITPGKK